jgi:hypothetical protein
VDPGVEAGNVMVKLGAINFCNRMDGDLEVSGAVGTTFELCGRIWKTSASDDGGVTGDILSVVGTTPTESVTVSTQLKYKGTTYTSGWHRRNAKRQQHSMIFKILVNR